MAIFPALHCPGEFTAVVGEETNNSPERRNHESVPRDYSGKRKVSFYHNIEY